MGRNATPNRVARSFGPTIMKSISVILCTHNPRIDYLTRTLQALRNQTILSNSWELLVIDNASDPPVNTMCDLSWHPNARFVDEKELGMNPTRLAGIREAVGQTIVFVDDDNLLSPDYLSRVLEIANRWPVLGAWGGSNVGEFE